MSSPPGEEETRTSTSPPKRQRTAADGGAGDGDDRRLPPPTDSSMYLIPEDYVYDQYRPFPERPRPSYGLPPRPPRTTSRESPSISPKKQEMPLKEHIWRSTREPTALLSARRTELWVQGTVDEARRLNLLGEQQTAEEKDAHQEVGPRKRACVDGVRDAFHNLKLETGLDGSSGMPVSGVVQQPSGSSETCSASLQLCSPKEAETSASLPLSTTATSSPPVPDGFADFSCQKSDGETASASISGSAQTHSPVGYIIVSQAPEISTSGDNVGSVLRSFPSTSPSSPISKTTGQPSSQ